MTGTTKDLDGGNAKDTEFSLPDRIPHPSSDKDISSPEALQETSLPPPCQPGQARTCGNSQGACQKGNQICETTGTWGPCLGSKQPTSEKCDGKDNDCNGRVDDGLSQETICQTGLTAPCSQGRMQCSNGTFKCIALLQASQESCDGKDNNCDGQVDETCKAQCVPCTQDLECKGQAGTGGRCLEGSLSQNKFCFRPCQNNKDCSAGYTCRAHNQGGVATFCLPPLLNNSSKLSQWVWWCDNIDKVGQPCRNDRDCGAQGQNDQGAECKDRKCTVSCRKDSHCPPSYTCDDDTCKKR